MRAYSRLSSPQEVNRVETKDIVRRERSPSGQCDALSVDVRFSLGGLQEEPWASGSVLFAAYATSLPPNLSL